MSADAFPDLWGYERADGLVGFRNLVLISSLSDLTNDVALRIAKGAPESGAVLSAKGGLSFGADEALDAHLQRQLATHPNVGAVVALAPTRPELDALAQDLSGGGRPLETLCAFEDADTSAAVAKGVRLVEQLQRKLGTKTRTCVGPHSLRIGLRSSSTTRESAATVHVAVGQAVSVLAGEGAGVAFTELADLAAIIEETAARAAKPGVRSSIRERLQRARATLEGLGGAAPDPTPLNRLGGISSLKHKSEVALRRLGEAPINSVLCYGEAFQGAGLHMVDGPGSAAVSLTGLAAAHCNILIYTVGATTWAPNLPLCPVVMVGGARLQDSPDLEVVARGSPRDGQNIIDAVVRVANGTPSAVERRAGEFLALPNGLAAL